MEPSIDREKVIKGLNCCCHTDGVNCIYCPYDNADSDCTALMSMDVLALLKEQEPKIGHWILDPDGMDWNIPAWTCSECGGRHNGLPIMEDVDETNIYLFAGSRFCPNCGVKMSREWLKNDRQR